MMKKGQIKLQKFYKKNEKSRTSALRLFKGDDLKYVISYSKALNKKGWVNDESKRVRCGYLKSNALIFTARALIIGNHKISLLCANTNNKGL